MSNNRYDADEAGRTAGRAEQVRALEAENARLKREVAILTLDKLILGEVVEENDRGDVRKYPAGR